MRAFCEAGRQGSFKAAADALNLAPSTVSHEIRKLEAWMQTPLFSRAGRNTELTAEGLTLFTHLNAAFTEIDAAFEHFSHDNSQSLKIGMFPFVASEFVLPMMDEFVQASGGQSLSIRSDTHLSALTHKDPEQRTDAVIRYSITAPQGYESQYLTDISLAIIGNRTHAPNVPMDQQRRIEMAGGFDGWGTLARAGIAIPSLGPAIQVDNYLAGMRAVEQGIGLGVALLPLCATWLVQERVRLVDQQTLTIPQGYWMVWRSTSAKAPQLRAVASAMAQKFTDQRDQLALSIR